MNTHLSSKDVHVLTNISNKKRVLQTLAELGAAQTGIDESVIYEALLAREKLGSTGVGRGVAIPHCKLKEASEIAILFLKLDKPVDFDSVDEAPVDLFFLLLAPENAGTDHLKALALVSRMMRDAEFCEKLRGAYDRDTVYALLSSPIEKAA